MAGCLAVLLIAGASCKKSNAFSINGTWEIRTSQNGITPVVHYAPGNDSLLVFTSTTYAVYSKGKVVKSGTYVIVEDNSLPQQPGGSPSHRIIYDSNMNVNSVFVQVSGNTLTIVYGDFEVDGGSDTQYEKL